MKNFIVCDPDGNILRTGTCPDSVFDKQASHNTYVIEGKADDKTDKIDIATKKVIKK